MAKTTNSPKSARPHPDTAARGSTNPESAATWPDLHAAQAHQSLGRVIDLVSTIAFRGRDAAPRRPRAESAESDRPLDAGGNGAARHPYHSKDIIGRVYEYFLSEFASTAGETCGIALTAFH